jgi:hypothetical protein
MLAAHCNKSLPHPKTTLVKYVRDSTNAAGYIVERSMFEKLVAVWKAGLGPLRATGRHWEYQGDVTWKALQTGDWFVFQPLLGYQRPSFSDLSKTFTHYDNRSDPNVRLAQFYGKELKPQPTQPAALEWLKTLSKGTVSVAVALGGEQQSVAMTVLGSEVGRLYADLLARGYVHIYVVCAQYLCPQPTPNSHPLIPTEHYTFLACRIPAHKLFGV